LSRAAREQPYETPNSFGPTYGRHRQALELSGDDYHDLIVRAKSLGLLAFATACDIPSADLLADLGVDALKVASRDLSNLPLIKHLTTLQKPIIASTGMSDWGEIDAAVEILRKAPAGCVLLHCTSLYPTPWHEAHLRSIPALAERYRLPVGFSDHTPGTLAPPVAVALGATLIEKHLTLDRGLKGTDHACSLEPEELRQMIEQVRQTEQALGRADKPVPGAVAAVRARLGRSLVTRAPLAAGVVIEEHMLTLKCPGDGISWLERTHVVGRRTRRAVPADQVLLRSDVE
jgi:sialic acid synthase SpsE